MRLKNFYRIEKFKPEIKTMIENLQDELTTYKQKVLKFCANRRSWRAKKCLKTFFKILERQDMQNQTIFELYTDDNQSKYSSNPEDILKHGKKIMKNSTSN